METAPIFFIGFSVCWYMMQAAMLLKMSAPSRLQRLLGFTFLWWGISTLKDMVFYLPGINTEDTLRHVFFIDGYGAVPFALLILELTMPGWITARRFSWLSLPFIAFLTLHFWISDRLFDQLFTLFFMGFAWIIFLFGIYKGRQYAHAIRQQYSNLEDVEISWVWSIFVAFFICQHVWLAVADTLMAWADSFYYASSLICWHFTLRGVNHLRPFRLSEKDVTTADTVKEPITESSAAMRKHSGNLSARLEKVMEEEQLYLNPDLTMSELSLHVGTNRTYLSEYFSAEQHTTFYEYINRLRIERSVLPLMQDNNSLSLETIAAKSGFKSMSTFRRAFRKFTGQLPSDYMRH